MRNLILCKILTFIRFFAEALFFPFLSLYFSNVKGFNVEHIGILIAAIPITAIVCSPIYSKLCTNPKKTRTALMIMSVIEAGFVILLLFANTFWLALLGIILLSIMSSSNYGMIDSLLTLIAEDNGKRYSSIRIYGSTSYMFGVLFSGVITKYTSYSVSFIIACSLFLLVGVLYFFIQTPQSKESKGKKKHLTEIIKNPLFIGYVIFYVLYIGSMQVGDDFFSLYMDSKGGGEYYSLVSFGFIGVEILTMLLLNHFGKRLGIQIFFVSLVLLIIRNIAHAIPNTPLWLIVAFQMVRGVIWASTLFMSSTFVSKILGYDLASSGIIIVMFGVQIFSAIFKFSGGYIIRAIGYSNFYAILLFFSIFAFIYYIFYYRYYKKISKTELIE